VNVGERYDFGGGILSRGHFNDNIVFYGIDVTASYPRYKDNRTGTEILLPPSRSPSSPF
jgi:hypothetical protein